MADGGDAEILQIVNSQFRQHRAVDFVVAERRLVLPQTEAPQPISDVHRRTRVRFDSYDGPRETASPEQQCWPAGRGWPVAMPLGTGHYLRGAVAHDVKRSLRRVSHDPRPYWQGPNDILATIESKAPGRALRRTLCCGNAVPC